MDSRKFFQDDGDNTVRLNYDLTESSLVLDVGFHEGDYAKKIKNKYNCNIIGYEPMYRYYDIAKKKFINDHKIKINNYGLGIKNEQLLVRDLGVATSILNISEDGDKIFVKDVLQEFEENKFNFIDLMKINIEGAEYHLLKKMIENNLHKKIKNLQIQFHKEYENEFTRENIWNELKKTHTLTYNYDYVWENWRLL
jgi:FkbM family methyltransferase